VVIPGTGGHTIEQLCFLLINITSNDGFLISSGGQQGMKRTLDKIISLMHFVYKMHYSIIACVHHECEF
jgi:hypothetical protein